MMRDRDRDELLDEISAYRRPTASAWLAAIAVAFAVFVLGGFIKTYRQLESLRGDSAREIGELRDALDAIRKDAAAGQAAGRVRPDARTRRNAPRGSEAGTDALRQPAGSLLPSLDETRLAADPAAPRPRTPVITASGGLSGLMVRDARPATAPSAAAGKDEANRIRVIAVNNSRKKIMVEGGRDIGFAEGARLSLYRSGSYIGETRVVEVFDNISACEVLHATRIPEPGDLAVRLYDPVS